MAHNKLEKQFRDSLNEREIKPSSQAWNRLDAMLEIEATNYEIIKEKAENKFNWLLFAACFIGFVFVLTFFVIKENDNLIIQKQVVNQEIDKENIKKVKENQVATYENQEPIITNNKKLKEIQEEESVNEKSVSIIKKNLNQVVTNVQIEQKEIIVELPSNIKKTEIITDLNQISNSENLDLSPIILSFQPKKITVNANSLLSQIDDEVMHERQKTIFQKIGSNIQAVKVAFNERNIKK